MIRFLLCLFLVFICFGARSQADFFVLKKKGKSIQQFREGFRIAFQHRSGEWIAGNITKIANDSFSIRPYVVRYNMTGVDTLHFSIVSYALDDVAALPRKSAMLVFRNDRPVIIPGHEKFLWIKNGAIFQIAGAAYAGVQITNSLLSNEPPFAKENLGKLGIAAAVFLVGEILHLTYKQYLYVGKKYKLQYVGLKVQQKSKPF